MPVKKKQPKSPEDDDRLNELSRGIQDGHEDEAAAGLSPYHTFDHEGEDDEKPRWTCWTVISLIMFVLLCCFIVSTTVSGAMMVVLLQKVWFHCGLLTGIGNAAASSGIFFLLMLPFAMCMNKCKKIGAGSNVAKKICVFLPLYLAYLILTVVLFALTAVCIIVLLASTTVNDLNHNESSVQGIDGVITITRDEHGITHIRAASQADAVFGQGFAHGQDRLWQIEFQRLAYKGELAAHLGEAAVKTDKQTRTLNFRNAAATMCNNISTEHRDLLQHYADGLNFYMKSTWRRPVEFLFMSKSSALPISYHEPEQFVVEDICGAARMLQWTLGANIPREIERFKMYWEHHLSYDEIEDLFVNQTNLTGTVLTAADLGITEADAQRQRAEQALDFAIEKTMFAPGGYIYNLRERLNPGNATVGSPKKKQDVNAHFENKDPASLLNLLEWSHNHASNAWVGRGDNGTSCQASDPHLNLNAPSIWYYTHLSWGDYDTAGVGMLGIPGVHIGKTTTTSWGITMSMTDLGDLFLMVPSVTKPDTHYVHNGRTFPT